MADIFEDGCILRSIYVIFKGAKETSFFLFLVSYLIGTFSSFFQSFSGQTRPREEGRTEDLDFVCQSFFRFPFRRN